MGDITGYCWHCHSPLGALDFGREGTCPSCGRQTHVCRNCRFYRPGLSNACQEPVAEHVPDKARANFCDYFTPNPSPPESGRGSSSEDELLAAAEALFKSADD